MSTPLPAGAGQGCRLSFLVQISEIWPRFKLVGLKKCSWPFGLISSWLALRNSFGLLALVWLFYAKKIPLKKNITYPFFSATHLRTYRPDPNVLMLVMFEGWEFRNKVFAH